MSDLPDEQPMHGFQEIFEIRKVNNSPLRGSTAHKDAGLPGLIACTTPVSLADGREFVAIGCSQGIWVVDSRDPDFMHRIMDLKGVTQFVAMKKYNILLVLAEKALYYFSLNALDPYNPDVHKPTRLTGTTRVEFFRVGMYANALVVIINKSNTSIESVFKILEPVSLPHPINTTSPLTGKLDDGLNFQLRDVKEFYVPDSVNDLIFFKGQKLAVVHSRGLEILNLDNLSSMTIPDFPLKDDPRSRPLSRRCKASKAIGIFRVKEDRSLICYDNFGLLIDNNGQPLYDFDHVIEWHGTTYAVILVAPYIILFKARSVEIRRGDTGRLEQVLFGSDMRCSWRGPEFVQGTLDKNNPQTAHERTKIQLVMNAPHGMGSDEVSQHVYDLILKENNGGDGLD